MQRSDMTTAGSGAIVNGRCSLVNDIKRKEPSCKLSETWSVNKVPKNFPKKLQRELSDAGADYPGQLTSCFVG